MKAIVKKKMPIGAGTPTGKNENGLAIILAKDGVHVNYLWRKFPEELPPESGKYIVHCDGGYIDVIYYSQRHNAWNAFDCQDTPSPSQLFDDVTHWMPLPPRPEGVDKP